jgi:anti-sigma B factor antagonist
MDVTGGITDTVDGLLVTVRGEIDLVTAPAVRQCLFDAVDEQPPGGRILVDLSGVTFFAAAGVRVLEAAGARAARGQVELVLVATSPAVALILGIVATPARIREAT